MKYFILFISVALLLSGCTNRETKPAGSTSSQKPDWAIVVHGGAGFMKSDDFTDEKEKAYRQKLSEALTTGGEILKNNGSSLDAVEAAINILEDSPLFNAGRGAVFNADGVNELDASFMDGKTLNAGAVANVKRIKNPVSAARSVMEKSPHVMLISEGAEKFASEQGLDMVEPEYFFTESRWESLQKAKEREKHNQSNGVKKSGTVGCVALDKNGNLAAGTSTGGMTNKKYGRVGDSPLIGAGTYADNNSCGVSATGHGEYFIRNVVAYDIAARIKYKGESIGTAADDIINRKLKLLNANGGVIAMDKNGNIAMPFNTSGMFRGFLYPEGEPQVFIYSGEETKK
jgi:L-asparaginase / beta-aspartyl-peptidase